MDIKAQKQQVNYERTGQSKQDANKIVTRLNQKSQQNSFCKEKSLLNIRVYIKKQADFQNTKKNIHVAMRRT